jgi:uncharacterized protein YndB with AHSA1/START domain
MNPSPAFSRSVATELGDLTMPKTKTPKRTIPARKTGTANPSPRTRASSKGSRSKTTSDLAELAGVADEAVLAKTGRTWRQWTDVLDAFGAAEKTHRETAAYVHETLGIDGWWAQSVTVGYERIRGLRDKGQRRDGSYEANKSRTYPVPLAKLYGAFATPARRRTWLPEPGIVVRRATAEKSMRLAWPDGSSVDLAFAAKAPGKSLVTVQHAKLPSRTAAARMKKYWEGHLETLAGTLGAAGAGRRRAHQG